LQSLSREKFRQIHRLKSEKFRYREDRFLIEGTHLCEEALASSWEVDLLLFTSDFSQLLRGKKLIDGFGEKEVKLFRVKREELEKLSDTKTPQGVAGIVKKKKFYLNKLLQKKTSLFLGLDNIRDPGNLGTIIRTADAAGADGVLLSRGCVELYNPKVVRSTMGSLFHLPVIEELDLKVVMRELKKSGFKVLVSEVHEGKDYLRIKYPEKTCLLVGGEATGINREFLNLADERIKIPIYGKAESLNASVAAGILLFDIAGKRKNIE